MVNKRGWLRIVEAFTAAILILGAIVIFLNTNKQEDTKEDHYIKDIEKNVLEEIANQEELRNLALEKNESYLKEKVVGFFQNSYEIEIRICNLTEKYCMMNREYPKKDIFVEDRIISGNLSIYNPVKVRIFAWRKD